MVIRFIPAAMLLALMTSAANSASEKTAAKPARLVSTDAAVTEIIVQLGVSDRLVAVDAASELPGGTSLPRVGYHRALAAEGLIALDADLLIGSEHMGPPHVLDAVERAGVEVLSLPYAGNIEILRENIQTIAAVTRSDRGPALVAGLDRQASELSRQALSSTRAALLLRAEGGKLRLAGSGTGGGGFLAMLGAENVAAYSGYRSVTPEGLLELAPDLLLLVDTEGQGAEDMIRQYPVLRFSPAVRAGQVHSVDADVLVAGISLAAVDEAIRIVSASHKVVARRAPWNLHAGQ